MSATYDPERLRLMALVGVPPALVTERVGVSERQLRRVLGSTAYEVCEGIGDPEIEPILWHFWHGQGWSFRKLEAAFGLSRETVRRGVEAVNEGAARPIAMEAEVLDVR